MRFGERCNALPGLVRQPARYCPVDRQCIAVQTLPTARGAAHQLPTKAGAVDEEIARDPLLPFADQMSDVTGVAAYRVQDGQITPFHPYRLIAQPVADARLVEVEDTIERPERHDALRGMPDDRRALQLCQPMEQVGTRQRFAGGNRRDVQPRQRRIAVTADRVRVVDRPVVDVVQPPPVAVPDAVPDGCAGGGDERRLVSPSCGRTARNAEVVPSPTPTVGRWLDSTTVFFRLAASLFSRCDSISAASQPAVPPPTITIRMSGRHGHG